MCECVCAYLSLQPAKCVLDQFITLLASNLSFHPFKFTPALLQASLVGLNKSLGVFSVLFFIKHF